jgi:hypothetical protein
VKGLLVVGVAVLLAACAAAPPLPSPGASDAVAAVTEFSFSTDTFSFPNQIRKYTPNAEYANYCFVLARAVRQFHQFARFEPLAPRLSYDEYVGRVEEVAAYRPYERALPYDRRVVIPGYATLREFSRGEEKALKVGLGGMTARFWSFIHWTNWRVGAPLPDGHQEQVAGEIAREIREGRLVQLLISNWPKPELNHTTIAYAYRDTPEGLEFTMWDPNDPSEPSAMVFQRARGGIWGSRGGFWASRVYATRPGPIRAWRVYTSRAL